MAKKDYVKPKVSSKTPLSMLLVPMSIVLVGVLIAVSILWSANVILERDPLVTKSNLQSAIQEALKNANLSSGGAQPTAEPIVISQDQVDNAVSTQPIVMGDKNSALKIIEFSDPSCPYCSIAAGNEELKTAAGVSSSYRPSMPEIEKLAKENKLSYTWIYLPTHGVGEVAAHVYYCANEKGKFWEVHNKLMVGEGYNLVEQTVKNDFSQVDKLADFVKDDVDRNFIISCVNSGKYKDQLTKDQTVAGQFGASGTPAFYVGTESSGPDLDSMEPLMAKYQ